jgi:hypothetical protein
MKANELRIGNLVCYSEDNTIFKIYAIERDGFSVENQIEATWIECGEFEPIPLTEEWLKKNGFERKGLNGYLTIFTPCGKGLVFKDNYFIFAGVTIETPIKYVHQLQNLYFALTSEELTFKSE